jgi:hypothetical protein
VSFWKDVHILDDLLDDVDAVVNSSLGVKVVSTVAWQMRVGSMAKKNESKPDVEWDPALRLNGFSRGVSLHQRTGKADVQPACSAHRGGTVASD